MKPGFETIPSCLGVSPYGQIQRTGRAFQPRVGVRSGTNRVEGLCTAVRLCGEKPAAHFPSREDDRDELSDELRIRRQGF